MGKKMKPFYRLVAADSRKARDGRFIEMLGYYDPMTDPADVKLDYDKIYKWLDRGAQPSESVKSLFRKAGVLERWRLLKEGVKITELDAVIKMRREKQPSKSPKTEDVKKVEKEPEESKLEEEKEVTKPAMSEETEAKDKKEEKEAEKGEKEKIKANEVTDQQLDTHEDSKGSPEESPENKDKPEED
jgi:small subunit ribosomal protein S16